MTVFQVRFKCDTYKALNVDRSAYATDEDYDAVFRSLQFNGQPKKPWSPPKMHFRNSLKPDPDFWQLLTSNEAFAVSARALNCLFSFFEMAGELLPLPVKDKKLQICNILRVYDCVDEARSEWRTIPGTNKRGALRTPVFVPEHMQISTLFKIPERLHTIYCWEVDRDPETEFKACVEKHKLKGINFIPVWSDEKDSK